MNDRRKVWPTDYQSQDADPKKETGIRCPTCGCKRLRVVYVRDYGPGARVRRRECLYCHRRFSTFERACG